MGPFIPFYSPASDFVNFTLSAPLSVSFTENIILKQNKLPVLLFENNARQKILFSAKWKRLQSNDQQEKFFDQPINYEQG